ncbi:MAG: acetyltransferase [Chthoniobacter sp.]|jgi:acetyltransferase|nr:acetyltransferase [Chthoniobacter sp.]
MKPRRKTSSGSEAKTVTPAAVKPHRLDAVPVTRAYLDGHLFRPAALTLRDGTHVTVRAITPEDEPRMVAFHKTLSDESVHFRYFGMPSLGFRTGHERLARLCSTDLAREIALVADRLKHEGEHEILGVGRLIKTPDLNEAEFAILVPDRWQGDGLGTALLKALVAIARKAMVRIFGHILPANTAMLHISRDVGFALRFNPDEGEWEAELDLRPKEIKRGIHAL